ncbi:MAG TPA: PTS fructose transporter subunit IIA [Erysipelotrichaceae bacterium]|nr:PTS fructose transporter subunit IIA [Erysipelotrichaceae bacterium]
MTGLILAGHGQFAEGMTSSLELIAGAQENYQKVNFPGGSSEEFTEDLKVAINNLSDCDNIVVLTDITGGTPFQMAAMLTQEHANLRVIGGVNVGLLIEISMVRAFEPDVDALIDMVLDNAKNAIAKFELPAESSDEEDSDGI